MPIPSNSVVSAQVKAQMAIDGFDLSKAPLSDKFVDALVANILNAVRGATVSTTVTVASVSGVTTGPGVSGPGAGTGIGTLS